MLPTLRSAAAYVLPILGFALSFLPGRAQQAPPTEYLVRPGLTGAHGGHLVTAVSADPASFNRMFMNVLAANAIIAEQISSDLVHVNRQTYELEPSLAMRWETAKDGRTYTIHLRRGIRFSDGSPFTADDVLFTLNALQDPRNPSRTADQLRVDNQFPTIERIDAFTVRLVWPRPVGSGLRALDSIPMLPRSRLLNAYQAGTLAQAWGPVTPPGEVVGLGPFRLREYQRGVKIVFERNPHYWKRDQNGRPLPYLDTLTFLIIPDINAQALRFQAGEVDILNTMSAELYASLRASRQSGEFILQDLGPGLGMDFLWFNLNPGKNPAGVSFVDPAKRRVFEREAFRRAVSHALDRDGIVRSVLLGLGSPQFGILSSGNKVWFDPAFPKTPFDVERAKALLVEVGLKDGDGDGTLDLGSPVRPFEITILTTRGTAARERAAEIIRKNLERIGIRAAIQLLLPNELGARLGQSYDYEAILFGFTPGDAAPDLQADLWYSRGDSHFWNPRQKQPATDWEGRIDALTTLLLQSPDNAERVDAARQVQRIWAEKLPAIPVAAPNILSGWRRSVGNTRPAILPPYLLWNSEELTKQAR